VETRDITFHPSSLSSFSIAVKNSENSIVTANLINVEIMFEDYTTENVSVESPPGLPYKLSIGGTVTLKCL
jgi:hypothetical protein